MELGTHIYEIFLFLLQFIVCFYSVQSKASDSTEALFVGLSLGPSVGLSIDSSAGPFVGPSVTLCT